MRAWAKFCSVVLFGALLGNPKTLRADSASEIPAWASAQPENESARPTAAPIPNPVVPSSEMLAKVAVANEDLYSELQSFVCREQMDRFKGRISLGTERAVDTVTAKVSFENGVEHYSEIKQNARNKASISTLTGAWSQGEFGTLLRQTEQLLRTQPVHFESNANLGTTPAAIYGFEVSEQDSPWDLEVSARHYHVPFRTDVWVSQSSGQILKIARTSLRMASETHITGIEWSISLEVVDLNGKEWLLPKTGEYEVIYEETDRREWNELSFSDYHRYGSEVALKFDSIEGQQ